MTTWNGFPTRAAYLEAERQERLEDAERCEHIGAVKDAAVFREQAARLLELVQEAKRAS